MAAIEPTPAMEMSSWKSRPKRVGWVSTHRYARRSSFTASRRRWLPFNRMRPLPSFTLRTCRGRLILNSCGGPSQFADWNRHVLRFLTFSVDERSFVTSALLPRVNAGSRIAAKAPIIAVTHPSAYARSYIDRPPRRHHTIPVPTTILLVARRNSCLRDTYRDT